MARRVKCSVAVVFGVVIVVAVGILARDIYAQVATVKAKGKALQTVEIVESDVANLTEVTVFTVPESRRLIITDILVGNENPGAALFNRIFRNGSDTTIFIAVPPESTFSHSFATGIEFLSGDTVSVRNGDNVGTIDFALYGYLTK